MELIVIINMVCVLVLVWAGLFVVLAMLHAQAKHTRSMSERLLEANLRYSSTQHDAMRIDIEARRYDLEQYRSGQKDIAHIAGRLPDEDRDKPEPMAGIGQTNL